jgi:hypothetical protein
MSLPQDPIILLSYINTKLRDYYSTLDDLCIDLDYDKNKIITTLESIDYSYNLKQNRFAPN